ncbi:Apyrase [Ancylostoma duodenale]|uniref:Apyrase n=1 Tax=Ancylostoma duodenale TaxID=51022 RepID=A0A0C2CJI6_9BILA|nr:Apyrase [Ancylostoma duodenale]
MGNYSHPKCYRFCKIIHEECTNMCNDANIMWPCVKCSQIFPEFPLMGHIFNDLESSIKNRIAPRNITIERHVNGYVTYQLLAITDMDREAKVNSKNWTWRAVTRRGRLTLSADKKNVSVEWMKDSDKNITSGFNYKGRGMELSDLSEYNGHLLAPDDKTGMLYEIKGDQLLTDARRIPPKRVVDTAEDSAKPIHLFVFEIRIIQIFAENLPTTSVGISASKAIPWVFLNSGPGNTTDGMKVEWLTIKDNKLYAGGHGCEYRNQSGHIVSEDPMWIKVITKSGQVRSKNWRSVYSRMRRAAGYRAPGYLTHEAVQWSSIQEMWYFLPRKASHTAYNETEDETKGTNLLILANSDLRDFYVVRIRQQKHPERGFSAFDFIPNTRDKLMVALKTEERQGKPTKSYFTVFSLNGTVLLPDQELDDGYKFEGIYFV